MRFQSPGLIVYGAGTRHELVSVLAERGVRRPLVVTDAFLVGAGVLSPVLDAMAKAGMEVEVYAGVQPDPTEENVASGLTLARRHEADGVVAFGGGSPIDCAKAVRQGYRPVLLAAVPTTAGTGSEASPVMVITDTQAGVKRMTKAAELMPDVAVVDCELSATMPRSLTAHVGVDTLTHGMEAFVSRRRHALSDDKALACIERTVGYLRRAWAEGTDLQAREQMALAALEGGLAFGNASVALVHGMSRPLGALFHIPHGLSNAVLLPAVTRFSYGGDPERYGEIARMMGVGQTVDALVGWLEELNRDLQVPSLRECCGGDWEAFARVIPKMATDALASGSPGNNPVVPTAEEIAALYRAAWFVN